MSELDYIQARVAKALDPKTLARLAGHDAKRASMYRAAMEAPKAAPRKAKLVSTRSASAPSINIPSRKAPPQRYTPRGDTGAGPGWIGGGNS